jgi:hypothetical protein
LLFFLLSCRCKRTTNIYDTQGQQQTNKQTLTPLPKNSPAAVDGQDKKKETGRGRPGVAVCRRLLQ